MSLAIVLPGMLTTVQDLGRRGYGEMGIPESGALDTYSLRIANLLVGNDESEAGLEITVMGPTLEMLDDAVIAVCGGDLMPSVNGEPLPMWESVGVHRGDRLAFLALRSGCRAYLAVAGGVRVPWVLGSKSTYVQGKLGGYEGRPLRMGDLIETGAPKTRLSGLAGRKTPTRAVPQYGSKQQIRVVIGPQDDYFSRQGIETFLSSEYMLTPDANRLGYKLEGPRIEHGRALDNISDPSPLGGIQVPPGGKPIILLVERGTVGGYTKIATVVSVDIAALGQAKPGDGLRFVSISISDARRLYREREAVIASLRHLFEGPVRPGVG